MPDARPRHRHAAGGAAQIGYLTACRHLGREPDLSQAALCLGPATSWAPVPSVSESPVRAGPLRDLMGGARGAFGGRGSARLVERHAVFYRHTWFVLASGVVEPLFYLLSIGVGVGKMVGPVHGPGGQPVSYLAFVAPALLASASMNGAMFDSTFNVFFRLKYDKLYAAALATPIRPSELALGEISWAVLRGGLYSVAFMAVTLAMGLVDSAWARWTRCRPPC